ncbi:unnamed protein product [Caenorhabditis brenneri]
MNVNTEEDSVIGCIPQCNDSKLWKLPALARDNVIRQTLPADVFNAAIFYTTTWVSWRVFLQYYVIQGDRDKNYTTTTPVVTTTKSSARWLHVLSILCVAISVLM